MSTKHASDDWPLNAAGKPVRRIKVEKGLYRSRSGAYEVPYRDANGKQAWRRCATLTEARAARGEVVVASFTGDRPQPRTRGTFGEPAKRLLEAQRPQLKLPRRAGYA